MYNRRICNKMALSMHVNVSNEAEEPVCIKLAFSGILFALFSFVYQNFGKK